MRVLVSLKGSKEYTYMIPKNGGQMHQGRGVPLGNDIGEMVFKSVLQGWGERVGLLSLSLDVWCGCLCIRAKPHSPELEFSAVASELPEQAMDVLPVLFASVPYMGCMETQVKRGEFGSGARKRGRGREGGEIGTGGHVEDGVWTGMDCRAHHEPDPASASDPRAGAEFSDFRVPVVVAEGPVVFETVVLYLAAIGSHVDHPGGGDPAPGSVGERVVVEGEVWVVCTRCVVVWNCEWLWIGGEEGVGGIKRRGEEGDSRGWSARKRRGGDDGPSLVFVEHGPAVQVFIVVGEREGGIVNVYVVCGVVGGGRREDVEN
jgi:hypothetical protein